MSLNNLEDLLVQELKDLYSAETQIVKALPKMAKAASSPDLQKAFEDHLDETKNHVQRLEKILKNLNASGKGKKCKGMEGLLEEGKEVLEEDTEDAIRDAALIGAAQRVEHYEIAAYGTAQAFAKILGHDDIVKLLDETLEEEKAADSKLNDLAESSVNMEAVGAGKE